MELTNEQWKVVKPLIPNVEHISGQVGRPFRNPRDVLNGILWILRTGAQWQDIPDKYPPYQTCHRRFQKWVKTGVFEEILKSLAKDLQKRGGINLSECFIDGTFAPAKKGGSTWEKPSVGRVQRSWQLQTALVFLSPYPSQVLHRMK